jgi:hypothetical protein
MTGPNDDHPLTMDRLNLRCLSLRQLCFWSLCGPLSADLPFSSLRSGCALLPSSAASGSARDVRFTPESGHAAMQDKCLLSAKSGREPCSLEPSALCWLNVALVE